MGILRKYFNKDLHIDSTAGFHGQIVLIWQHGFVTSYKYVFL